MANQPDDTADFPTQAGRPEDLTYTDESPGDDSTDSDEGSDGTVGSPIAAPAGSKAVTPPSGATDSGIGASAED
jgi:hypothetical protein